MKNKITVFLWYFSSINFTKKTFIEFYLKFLMQKFAF